jgi:TRAP-type C4-dicarboxylate transport system permease small subunit
MLVTAIPERRRRALAATISLLCVAVFALLAGGCADAYYANLNANRTPLARYNTYYAPDYYPYYPWDGYYGGAYYYDH